MQQIKQMQTVKIRLEGTDKYVRLNKNLSSTACVLKARCNLRALTAMFIGPGPERWGWANELTWTLAFYPPARPAKPWAFCVNTIQTVQ